MGSFVRRPLRHALSFGTAALALATALPAQAQDDSAAEGEQQEEVAAADAAETPNSDPIFVFGRSERRIGTAGAASEGGVAGADLEIRPLLRPGEILEATPGLIATQH
jgi:hypothetical protein